jgi:hypothetical protein
VKQTACTLCGTSDEGTSPRIFAMTILFLHGWNSVAGGVKPTYLAQHGHEVINPALDDDDWGEAVRTAQAEYDRHHPDVIVGSSRGGAVAMNFESGTTPLVLLCPAWRRGPRHRRSDQREPVQHQIRRGYGERRWN